MHCQSKTNPTKNYKQKIEPTGRKNSYLYAPFSQKTLLKVKDIHSTQRTNKNFSRYKNWFTQQIHSLWLLGENAV